MPLQRNPGPAKAALHYRRAGEYQGLAQDILARVSGDLDPGDTLVATAGALLYEAAKQCVNAVANLNGRDPQANHEKMAELLHIVNAHPNYPNLIDGAASAWLLHIHADQANLTRDEFAPALARTGRFVADMRAIYRAAGGAVAG